MKRIRKKIRLIREMKGFSQENMADIMHIIRTDYGLMERGQRNLNEARIAQIADILGVTPKDIHNFDGLCCMVMCYVGRRAKLNNAHYQT